MVGGGAANGFISGFAVGGLQAAVDGGNFWQGALMGGLSGAAIGGAAGAMQRLMISKNEILLPNENESSRNEFKSTNDVRRFASDNIGSTDVLSDRYGGKLFLGDGNAAKSLGYEYKDGFMIGSNGKVGGVTIPVRGTGFFNRMQTNIYISSGVKGLSYAKMVFVHEYIHAAHYNRGLMMKDPNFHTNTERTAWSYTKQYIIQNGIKNFAIPSQYNNKSYPSAYGFADLGMWFRLF